MRGGFPPYALNALMKISPNKRIFERHFSPAFPSGREQGEFEFMKEQEEA
jgi:hypothetical protein